MIGFLTRRLRDAAVALALILPATVAADDTMPPAIGLDPAEKLRNLAEERAVDIEDRSFLWGRNRVQVADTTVPPYRAIGFLYAEGGGGANAQCTGIFVGPRTVLTAAHCLYDENNESWREDFLFAPGLETIESAPLGVWAAQEAAVFPGFIENYSTGNAERILRDAGLIRFREPIGETLGWIGLASELDATSTPIKLIAYYGDKPAGTVWEETCAVVTDGEPEALLGARGCDRAIGTSGGVALVEQDGELRLAGIVVAENADGRIVLPITGDLAAWVAIQTR